MSLCDWCSQLKEHKLFPFQKVICEHISLSSLKQRQFLGNQVIAMYVSRSRFYCGLKYQEQWLVRSRCSIDIVRMNTIFIVGMVMQLQKRKGRKEEDAFREQGEYF